MDVNENSNITIPLRNLLSLIAGVGIAVVGYFHIDERIMMLEHEKKIIAMDVEHNSDFRIKWPRGELGSLPADSEQFMLLEHIAGQIEKHDEQLESGMHNKVNIDFLKAQIKKLQDDVELLKDKVRQNGVH